MSLDDRIDKPAQTGRRFIRGREIEPTILKRDLQGAEQGRHALLAVLHGTDGCLRKQSLSTVNLCKRTRGGIQLCHWRYKARCFDGALYRMRTKKGHHPL